MLLVGWATLGACQGDWDKACDEVFKQGKGIIDACLKAEVEIFSLGLHSQTFTCVDHPEIDGYFRCCRWCQCIFAAGLCGILR